MRIGTAVLAWWIAATAGVAGAQTLDLRATIGPTLVDAGLSVAAEAGLAPAAAIAIVGGVERSRLDSRTRRDGRYGVTTFRGGALTVGTLGLRLQWPRQTRLAPYLVAGYAGGRSRPTVNAAFPNRITNDVRAVFGGAGLAWAVGPRLRVVVDARMLVGDEAHELLALIPLRAGMAWRF